MGDMQRPERRALMNETVADMQRGHFEQCCEVPDRVRQLYKQKLKATHPNGVGSP